MTSTDNASLTRLQRFRYSVMEKHLRKTIQELESWHATFDPSWLLITLPSTKIIDSALKKQAESQSDRNEVASVLAIRAVLQGSEASPVQDKTVFRQPEFLNTVQQHLPHSSLTLSTLSESGASVILDTAAYPAECDRNNVTTDVRNLARILAHSEPSTLGLLHCLGVLKISDPASQDLRFQFVYSPPANLTDPATLRSLLFHPAPSLDAKFRLAKVMARSVTAVHSAGFVHKSIRPDTVLVFHDDGDDLPAAFLVGFERFRAARSGTALTTDMVWHRNIYRHPTRQGRKSEDMVPYIMQHDIYSLGVCLLELGIWSSFVSDGADPQPGALLKISQQLRMTNVVQAAWEIRGMLLDLAKDRLPQIMGNLYTTIVISCLTCLDSGASNIFATEEDLWDEDGVLVAVAFIEKILQSLEAVSLGIQTQSVSLNASRGQS